jgi:hypothetical protein
VCEVYVSVCFRVGACEYVRVHVSACASLCLCVRACGTEEGVMQLFSGSIAFYKSVLNALTAACTASTYDM